MERRVLVIFMITGATLNRYAFWHLVTLQNHAAVIAQAFLTQLKKISVIML